MAALGKGNSRSAGVRWRRRGVPAAVALAAALLAGSAGPARASQDPLFGAQWALQEIGAPTAWQRSTGAGVRIGIVDSGVFAQQELLFEKKRIQTLDWTYPDYRSYEYQNIFKKIRENYLKQTKESVA